jgi:hypothetical protein
MITENISPHCPGLLILAPGTRYGVYQMLSTRNGGEVVSSDQY